VIGAAISTTHSKTANKSQSDRIFNGAFTSRSQQDTGTKNAATSQRFAAISTWDMLHSQPRWARMRPAAVRRNTTQTSLPPSVAGVGTTVRPDSTDIDDHQRPQRA
jgi:hypothetical protein